jgi:hypothetical protein
MLNQMLMPKSAAPKPLQPNGDAPETDKTTGRGAVAPNAPTLAVKREGDLIVNRVGRLTRGADSQQMEFTFDADAQAMQDPPVVILPNLKLMLMEDAVKSSSRDLRFQITGVLTEYRGRNYVLLDKVVVVSDITEPLTK